MASEEMDRALTRVKNAIKKLSAKGGVKMASEVWDVNEALAAYQGAVEEVLKRYEDVAQEAADEEALARLNYDLAHRRLIGLVDEIRPLARKQPDARCNEYKLRRVNQVLLALKEELDVCFDADLDLADEDASLSYSDLSFLLRGYLDLSSAYARRRYGLSYEENGK